MKYKITLNSAFKSEALLTDFCGVSLQQEELEDKGQTAQTKA